MPPTTKRYPTVEGHYDVRQGAAGYAPIIGAVGALAVPAIIVLFTVSQPVVKHHAESITLAAGLLIVSMISSLIASIALAGIGAEQEPTANLPAAVMFVAVPAAISIVNMLAAFETLAAIYLRPSKLLFLLIVAAGGVTFAFFASFPVGDSWSEGPADLAVRDKWLARQWIQSPSEAYRAQYTVATIATVPILLGAALRVADGSPRLTPATVNFVVFSGLVLAMSGTLYAARRAQHRESVIANGLSRREAFGSTLALSSYILALLICLP